MLSAALGKHEDHITKPRGTNKHVPLDRERHIQDTS